MLTLVADRIVWGLKGWMEALFSTSGRELKKEEDQIKLRIMYVCLIN
jgi:hypothetical protein